MEKIKLLGILIFKPHRFQKLLTDVINRNFYYGYVNFRDQNAFMMDSDKALVLNNIEIDNTRLLFIRASYKILLDHLSIKNSLNPITNFQRYLLARLFNEMPNLGIDDLCTLNSQVERVAIASLSRVLLSNSSLISLIAKPITFNDLYRMYDGMEEIVKLNVEVRNLFMIQIPMFQKVTQEVM